MSYRPGERRSPEQTSSSCCIEEDGLHLPKWHAVTPMRQTGTLILDETLGLSDLTNGMFFFVIQFNTIEVLKDSFRSAARKVHSCAQSWSPKLPLHNQRETRNTSKYTPSSSTMRLCGGGT